MVTVFFFFFFQAEDGIRDRSPSRGLGDVYKRQDVNRPTMGQTALETKSLCFNMGKCQPLFGSGRDMFIKISSPTYAANRTESIGANRMLIYPPWVKRHSKRNPYALT